MNTDRSQEFVRTARNLELSPLLNAEEISLFRIDYGHQVRKGLKNKLKLGVNRKIIFTGHIGSGKSTLLVRFAEEMSQEGKFVVFFSIADMVEMSKVNHINILYSIALSMLRKAAEESVPISPAIKKSIEEWFLTTKTKTYTDRLKNEFSAKLHKEDSFREEIKITYELNIQNLVEKINEVSALIQSSTDKELLVIIDDLDKLDIKNAKAIYHENLNNLRDPRISIIFTIPIDAMRDSDISGTLKVLGEPQLLTVPKFYSQQTAHKAYAKPFLDNVRILQDLLKKRIDADLIEEETMYKMVLLSGGLLRELVRLSQQCCEECLSALDDNLDNDLKIDDSILEKAVKTLRNNFAKTLGTKDFEILKDVYQNFTPPDTMEPAFLKLLHNLCILEYENDDLWYDLHPIIVDLLQRKNLIPLIT
jgi:energy-coupling factor transporter ATP-binding protein EcfA2